MGQRLIAIILALVMLAACSAEVESIAPVTEQAQSDTNAGGVVADGDADVGSFSVLRSLEQLPASAADDAATVLQIFAADLDAAGEQAGLTRPGNTTDPDALFAFFGPLTGQPRDDRPMRVFVPLPMLFADGAIPQAGDFAAELGFSIGGVSAFAALDATPAQFLVATGVAAPDDLPEVVPGVRTLGDGDDFTIDPEGRTAARRLGRPLRIAEQDGRLALSLATVPVIDWLTGPGAGTMADNVVLAALAERLDEEQVVSAALVVLDDDAYGGIGLGWSADDAGARGVIVFSYESTAAAQDQLARIESAFSGESVVTAQPMAELVSLETIEVRGAEIVVGVRFPDDRPPSMTWRMLIQRDGPFAEQS